MLIQLINESKMLHYCELRSFLHVFAVQLALSTYLVIFALLSRVVTTYKHGSLFSLPDLVGMLVRLVNAVLQRFLGQYVENLDTERLSYSLGYSGSVVLTDLHLKADALSHILGLPLRLKSGLIARVQLSIPLTQLRSQPWCITIEDADLVIYPSNSDDIATDSAPSDTTTTSAGVNTNVSIIEESRKAYLDRLESRWWQVVREGGLVDAVATTSPTDSSWWSYGVSLVYGVVSNLHVEIRNVHFSFVDENGLIGGNFTWGIRLERMTIQATDASWASTFAKVLIAFFYRILQGVLRISKSNSSPLTLLGFLFTTQKKKR